LFFIFCLFTDAGLDSLGAVEFKNVISQQIGLEIPVTATIDYPSVTSLVTYLEHELAQKSGGVVQPLSRHTTLTTISTRNDVPATNSVTLGVNAFAFRVSPASSAGSSSESVSPLCTDTITPVPLSRWDIDASSSSADSSSSSAIPARFGGFLPEVEQMDETQYGISRAEAALMDPQQRLLLLCNSESLSRCGLGSGGFKPVNGQRSTVNVQQSTVGVFVGISALDYLSVLAKSQVPASAYAATGGALSVAAGRMAFFFGAQGPAVSKNNNNNTTSTNNNHKINDKDND
jgi:hypothetical protein